jgi:hypothetical protein
VVALGNPDDAIPPYGAARGYFDNETWQQAVARLAQASSAIIICLDDTDGIWWEVDQIAANNIVQKTLFLIHPRNSATAENENLIRKVARKLALSDDLKEEFFRQIDATPPQGRILGLFFDHHDSLKVARSATFSRIAFLMTLRWFVRTRFSQNRALIAGQ